MGLCLSCRPVAEDCEGLAQSRVPAAEQLRALGPRRALYFVSVTQRETPAAEAHWAGQHDRALGLRPPLELEPIKALKMGPLLGMVSLICGTWLLTPLQYWLAGGLRDGQVRLRQARGPAGHAAVDAEVKGYLLGVRRVADVQSELGQLSPSRWTAKGLSPP